MKKENNDSDYLLPISLINLGKGLIVFSIILILLCIYIFIIGSGLFFLMILLALYFGYLAIISIVIMIISTMKKYIKNISFTENSLFIEYINSQKDEINFENIIEMIYCHNVQNILIINALKTYTFYFKPVENGNMDIILTNYKDWIKRNIQKEIKEVGARIGLWKGYKIVLNKYDSIERGKQIDIGKEKAYLVIKWFNIIGGLIVSFSPLIGIGTLWLFYNRLVTNFPIEVILIFVLPIVTGLWLFIAGLRMNRIEMYEKGFTPRVTPYSFWFKRKEFFVPWKDIVWVKYLSGTNPINRKEMWIFILVTKDKKSFSIILRDCAPDKRKSVFKALKNLEKDVKSKYQKPKRIRPFW